MMLSDYLNDEITLVRETKNEFNEVTNSEEIQIQARVEYYSKNVSNKSGKDILSSFLIFALEDCGVLETDKIKYNNKTYEIISISHEKEFIQSHKEIYI